MFRVTPLLRCKIYLRERRNVNIITYRGDNPKISGFPQWMLKTFPLSRVDKRHVSLQRILRHILERYPYFDLPSALSYTQYAVRQTCSLLARSRQEFYKRSLFSSANNLSKSFLLRSPLSNSLWRKWLDIGAPVGWRLYKEKLARQQHGGIINWN